MITYARSGHGETPLEAGFEISESDFVKEPTEDSEMITLYRSLIGSIGYAAVTVRFDVSYALSDESAYSLDISVDRMQG